jgi:hypothetical protein
MSDPTMIPRYSMEEFARRGDEIYERDVLPKLTPEDRGFVATAILKKVRSVRRRLLAYGQRLRVSLIE